MYHSDFIFRFILSLLIITVQNCGKVYGYYVILTADGPAVLGATLNFTAELYDDNGDIPTGDFKFEWSDSVLYPKHNYMVETKNHTSNWHVTYNREECFPGPYEVQVVVSIWRLVYYSTVTSQRANFNLTEMLNGQMGLLQGNETRTGNFISSAKQVNHEVVLKQTDLDFLKHNATNIKTYWFIDCIYYGFTSDYKFQFNYTEPEKSHIIEALVVAGFEPIPTTTVPPLTTTTPVTTTSTTTTTTPKPTTTTIAPIPTTSAPKTTKPNSTTVKPVDSTTAIVISNITTTSAIPTKTTGISERIKREISDVSTTEISSTTTMDPKIFNITVPYVCLNKSIIPPDQMKTYGYFHRKIDVKAPVSNLTITGNNWLQHGEMLSLDVRCAGSPSFQFCVKYFSKAQNTTNVNETCVIWDHIDVCQFRISRYLSEAKEYTILIIIKNDVEKIVSPVTVTVYKVIKKTQLSVIVVPITCSLAAVIIIVFGVAYYIQSRTSISHKSQNLIKKTIQCMRHIFTVEVADFDFGQQYSHLEYKTFRERLQESIVSTFGRTPAFCSEAPSGENSPNTSVQNIKYGSMT